MKFCCLKGLDFECACRIGSGNKHAPGCLAWLYLLLSGTVLSMFLSMYLQSMPALRKAALLFLSFNFLPYVWHCWEEIKGLQSPLLAFEVFTSTIITKLSGRPTRKARKGLEVSLTHQLGLLDFTGRSTADAWLGHICLSCLVYPFLT